MKNLFFSEKGLEYIKTAKGQEFRRTEAYIKDLIAKDSQDIFNPFCLACGIEKKYHKFAWHLLALEMKLFSLGILWAKDREPAYLIQAKDIIVYLTELPNWSDTDRKRISNLHPETVAVIRAVSFSLNIFGDDLGYTVYESARKKLAFVCQRIYEIIKNREDKHISDKISDVSVDLGSALGICAIIMEDKDTRTNDWLQAGKEIVGNFLVNLPEDGSYREGLLRWEYTIFSAFLFTHCLTLNGENTDSFREYINKAKYYALNCSAPMCSNTSQFDQSIHISIYNPLNGILAKMLAWEFKDSYLYWAIQTTPKKNYFHPLELFFADQNRDEKQPDAVSSFYPIAGKAFMRSGWNPDDSLITFKSSTISKHHSHKDQNNMEIFIGDTEMLIESGTCYLNHPNYEMRYSGTHAHNVILINGKPQLPIHNTKGGIKDFYTSPEYDLVCGDASSSYSKAKIYKRNILFLKPDIVLVYDYIMLNSSGNTEWLWHTPGNIHVHSLSKMKSILFENKNKPMSMFILSPETWSYRLTKDFVLDSWQTMHERTHDVIRIKSAYRQEINFFAVFCLNSKDHENLPGEFFGNTLNINHLNKQYSISFKKGKIDIN